MQRKVEDQASVSWAMQPKTEEFLNYLLWAADILMRPTFRNLTDSYESWAYRNGFLTQVGQLERWRYLERDPKAPFDRLYRLTELGRLHALGGRDPQHQWSRHWDGRWRLVLFDVPVKQNVLRERLRRYLRSRGFGCLQRSVWITPDQVAAEREVLAGGQIDVESLLLLEARPATGESDEEIVDGAWDFSKINHLYARHLSVLDRYPLRGPVEAGTAQALRCWAGEERDAWLTAVESDPLLPERLLPSKYLGRPAWERRKTILALAGEHLKGAKL